nr:uncharacterized protein CI109_007531 [Kwoniella shandongensis]KAA5524175.1 hypothetical protein CI109_007531 [Kwoniella shandongensis]
MHMPVWISCKNSSGEERTSGGDLTEFSAGFKFPKALPSLEMPFRLAQFRQRGEFGNHPDLKESIQNIPYRLDRALKMSDSPFDPPEQWTDGEWHSEMSGTGGAEMGEMTFITRRILNTPDSRRRNLKQVLEEGWDKVFKEERKLMDKEDSDDIPEEEKATFSVQTTYMPVSISWKDRHDQEQTSHGDLKEFSAKFEIPQGQMVDNMQLLLDQFDQFDHRGEFVKHPELEKSIEEFPSRLCTRLEKFVFPFDNPTKWTNGNWDAKIVGWGGREKAGLELTISRPLASQKTLEEVLEEVWSRVPKSGRYKGSHMPTSISWKNDRGQEDTSDGVLTEFTAKFEFLQWTIYNRSRWQSQHDRFSQRPEFQEDLTFEKSIQGIPLKVHKEFEYNPCPFDNDVEWKESRWITTMEGGYNPHTKGTSALVTVKRLQSAPG